MKITISQMKPYLADVEKNLKKMEENIEEAIKNEADIIVFPELSLTGNLLDDSVFDVGICEIPEKLLEFSRKITIVFGAVEAKKGKLYNTGYCLEDGKIIGKHRKVFLSNGHGGSESRYFTKGKEIQTFESRFGRFAIVLGEEGINPMVQGLLGIQNTDVVFCLVNEEAAVRKEKSVYEAGTVNSSFYNKCFNIVVNRTGTEDNVVFAGGSFAISPYGKIIEKMEQFTEKLSIINIDLNDTRRAMYSSAFDRENNLEVIKKETERLTEKIRYLSQED